MIKWGHRVIKAFGSTASLHHVYVFPFSWSHVLDLPPCNHSEYHPINSNFTWYPRYVPVDLHLPYIHRVLIFCRSQIPSSSHRNTSIETFIQASRISIPSGSRPDGSNLWSHSTKTQTISCSKILLAQLS